MADGQFAEVSSALAQVGVLKGSATNWGLFVCVFQGASFLGWFQGKPKGNTPNGSKP